VIRLRSHRPILEDRPVKTTSLRHRVVFGVLALMLALLVGLGLVVNAVLRDRLESDLHQRLKERAAFAQALAGQGLTDQELSDRLTGTGITATVGSGAAAVVGRDRPPTGLRPRGGPRPTQPSMNPDAVKVSQNGSRLSAQVSVEDRTVTVTANSVEIDHAITTLQHIEFAAGAVALLVLALLLWRVVGAALSPLDRMTGLARRITGGVRGRRLRPTRPGTEMGRTAVAFDAMLDSLEDAEAQAQGAEIRMRQFLADASHDLRTPIAGVITTAERVLRDNPGRVERELRLVELIREAQRAARLVADLLLMARLDAQEPPRSRPVDVVALVRRAVARIAVGSPAVSFEVLATGDPLAIADPDALHRVLANLLDNANNAAGPSAAIMVRVGVGDRIDQTWNPDGSVGTVVIDVGDNGPGVAAADRERIFDRFVRLDPSRQATAGTGLGLPIARALVRWQGGELSYVDEPGGATFRIVLPQAVGETPPKTQLERQVQLKRQGVVVAPEVDRGRVVADV
jgi:signal transduction histidine kinase